MATEKAKRRSDAEPVLSLMARRLGHAAGVLSNATQEFRGRLAGSPATVEARVRGMISPEEEAKVVTGRPRSRMGSKRAKKKSSRDVSKPTHGTTAARKGNVRAGKKSSRRSGSAPG
jgi:hypothetical protein